jgi:hypothetical protein
MMVIESYRVSRTRTPVVVVQAAKPASLLVHGICRSSLQMSYWYSTMLSQKPQSTVRLGALFSLLTV